jgi:hypothetical protein
MLRARTAMLLCAISATLLVASTCVSGQSAPSSDAPKTAGSHDRLPLVMLEVAVAPGARDAYFAALRAFAERNGFAIRIAPTTPSGKDFLTQLFRIDIDVFGANSLRVDGFALGFYSSCPGDPDAITRQDVTFLVADLKAALSKTKGVVVQVGR